MNEALAVAAKPKTQFDWVEAEKQFEPSEEYAYSHSALRALGALGTRNQVELRLSPEWGRAYANFTTALAEMLGTDEEFRHKLNIVPRQKFPYIDGQARNKDGRPLVEMVRTGVDNSAARAEYDKRFEEQNIRDGGDLHAMEIADSLQDGESYATASNSPRKGLRQHPELYKDVLGYDDLVYIQIFTRQGDTLECTAVGVWVEDKNEEAFREELAANGIVVPKGTSCDEWIKHGQKFALSPEQAKELGSKIRDDFYKKVGLPTNRMEITEFVDHHNATVENIFYTYGPSLGQAIKSTQNNEIMQSLAQTMLQVDLSHMDANIRADLVRVANSTKFDDEVGKSMEVILRYVVAEELRKGLDAALNPSKQTEKAITWSTHTIHNSPTIVGAQIHHTNQLLARNLQTGLRAQRSYGGCAGGRTISMNGESDDLSNGVLSSTSDLTSTYNYGNTTSWGGGREKWKFRKGKCEVPKCPTRPKEVKLGPCGVCMERCQKLFDAGKNPIKMGGSSTSELPVFRSEKPVTPKPQLNSSNTSKNKVKFSYG